MYSITAQEPRQSCDESWKVKAMRKMSKSADLSLIQLSKSEWQWNPITITRIWDRLRILFCPITAYQLEATPSKNHEMTQSRTRGSSVRNANATFVFGLTFRPYRVYSLRDFRPKPRPTWKRMEKTRPKASLSLSGMTTNHSTEDSSSDRSQKNALKLKLYIVTELDHKKSLIIALQTYMIK